MPPMRRILATVVATFLVPTECASRSVRGVDSASCPNTLTTSYPAPVAAPGWSFRVALNGFKKPRSIQFDDNGGLLVLDAGVGVYRSTITTDDGDTCVLMSPPQKLIELPDLNHGLALSNDGKTLYASSAENVYSWAYNSQAGSVSNSKNIVVTNMADATNSSRTLLMSQSHPGLLIVNRGATDDSEMLLALNESSGHSQVRAFDLTSGKTMDFLDGMVLGWGLRNSVGLGESPSGGIWGTENGVDQTIRDGVDISQFNPADELNYLGNMLDPASIQGGNYGYPACDALWNTTNFPNPGALQPGDQYPNTGMSQVTDQTCNTDFVRPRLPLQAHASPLDIKFNNQGSTAFVSFHGSYSTPPAGYRVSSIAFDPSTGNPVADKASTTAAVDILTNRDTSKCPGGCFRPVGLTLDKRERLWFSSDATGEIFILNQHNGISPPPSPNCTNSCGGGSGAPVRGAAARTGLSHWVAVWCGGLVAVAAVVLV